MCFFSTGNSRNNKYPLYCWQTAASDIDMPLPFVYLQHCLSQGKETIWISPCWSAYSPCKPLLQTQYPNSSDLAPAPFIKRPQWQKHDAVKGPSSLSRTWQSQQKTEDVGMGSEKAHSPKASYHHEPSPALWLCEQEQSYYIVLHKGLTAVCNPNSEHQGWKFHELERLSLRKHDLTRRLKLEIRWVSYK